jgi:hypothetical protein
MSLRQAASDDEDEEEYVSDGKSCFTDSSDDEEIDRRLAPRTAPSGGTLADFLFFADPSLQKLGLVVESGGLR